MGKGNQGESRALSEQAWRRLKRDKLAMFGVFLICGCVLIAVLGSLIRPDASRDANEQIPSIYNQKPGFTVNILKVKKNMVIQEQSLWTRLFFGGKRYNYTPVPVFSYHFVDDKIVVEKFTGTNEETPGDKLVFDLVDVLYELETGVTPTYSNGKVDFTKVDGSQSSAAVQSLQVDVLGRQMETRTYWLGTDGHGRDMLSRLMAGTIVSLSVGLISVIISLLIGVLLGAIAGFFRGWVDDVIMWMINVVWAIPTLLLVIAITLALGKGFTQVFIAVGFTMWVEVARVVRGQVLSIREKEYVEAGRALGYGNSRLIWKHILPNVMSPVIVISAANFASAILIEAGLSFLGIGAQIPMASWGGMIKDHYGYFTTDMAYLAVLPGVAIMLIVLAFMLVGNGLRDALDTKSVKDWSAS